MLESSNHNLISVSCPVLPIHPLDPPSKVDMPLTFILCLLWGQSGLQSPCFLSVLISPTLFHHWFHYLCLLCFTNMRVYQIFWINRCNVTSTGVGVVMAGYGMFPSRILSTPTLSRGVISKVVTLPSSLLHLPSRETSDGASSEEYTHGGIDHDNNFTTSDTSKINTTTIIRRDLDHVSHYLMKLGITSSDTSNKSVPVPVVMQTSCSVYAGASGGPVVALHPSYGECMLSYGTLNFC